MFSAIFLDLPLLYTGSAQLRSADLAKRQPHPNDIVE
jgi:hypothetical protein